MNWQIANEVLSLASIDQDFCQELLADPLGAIQRYGFHLTERKQQVMSQARADDLTKLSQYILEQLAPEQI